MHPNQSYRFQDSDYKQKARNKCLLTVKLFNFYGENSLWFSPIHLHILLVKINKNLNFDQRENSMYLKILIDLAKKSLILALL